MKIQGIGLYHSKTAPTRKRSGLSDTVSTVGTGQLLLQNTEMSPRDQSQWLHSKPINLLISTRSWKSVWLNTSKSQSKSVWWPQPTLKEWWPQKFQIKKWRSWEPLKSTNRSNNCRSQPSFHRNYRRRHPSKAPRSQGGSHWTKIACVGKLSHTSRLWRCWLTWWTKFYRQFSLAIIKNSVNKTTNSRNWSDS